MLNLIPYTKREANLFSFMDDLERSFFNNAVSGKDQFRCDISEKDGNYKLEAELPGFDKKDIHVELNGDMLTINAEHKSEEEKKDENGRYVRRERRYGSFSRSFDVSGIDVDHIKADYKNGVLELDLPAIKLEEKAPEVRKIEIGD
ncbi:Hsp20/alpha crystallin family protein [Ruminococcaceae bacterium OttesenSCG-928-I18]|nr:Hsp20/alpha crystallin family protein [Ruminococcaceae bacterium OttesenSCG-928-I18]